MTSTIQRRAMIVVGVAAVAAASNAAADSMSDFQKIMDAYAKALNAGDVEALVAFYSPKGVYMREAAKAAVGTDALRAGYKEAFAALKLDLQLTVREAEVAGDMAWVRGVSKGTVKILKTGVEEKQAYNLLAVFGKEGGAWKIRAYLYGSNRPEPGQTPT
jgi:uncharacterized protein (TIGR02246 family)